MELLKLIDVCKSYGSGENKLNVLNNINFSIKEGEMIAIMGISGSGKSTLLNILGCLDTFDSGKYFINGQDVYKLNNKNLALIRNKFFGFVVQYFALIDDYTVFNNIKVPLLYSKTKKSDIKNNILNIMTKLNIIDKKNKYPNELSGGQNQRVAIARALVNNPKIILADEPTGALDSKTRNDVMDLFKELNNDGKTIIIVTHDDQIAKSCKRIITISDGKIINDSLNMEEIWKIKIIRK